LLTDYNSLRRFNKTCIGRGTEKMKDGNELLGLWRPLRREHGGSVVVRAIVSASLCLLMVQPARADDAMAAAFRRALTDGAASAPLPNNKMTQSAERAVKQRTGSDAPLVLFAKRIETFQQQPDCGRVAFVIAQPATNSAWKDMGGELNVCKDGAPPLRVCKSNPGQLIPYDAPCKDGSRPVDTPEVAAAIAAAVQEGGLTPDMLHQQFQASKPASGAAPGPDAASRR
jgi:hypothetical protein